MRFIHLSDLHIGKRVNGFNMIDDQEYILYSIISIIKDEQPDAVIIAGDIFDRTVPSDEALKLFETFITKLASVPVRTYIISGNHDSSVKVAYARELMALGGIHIAPVYDGNIQPMILKDEHGPVNIYLLPFIKPVQVRVAFPDAEVVSYNDAIRTAVANMKVDPASRNILVTHQFVTGATRSESEEISVGGTDNVDADCFDDFDYVALGHLHGPQSIGRPEVRYCGSPLKYSFSEAKQEKSVTVVELGAKGKLDIRTIPLIPFRDMREIRGSYMEVTSRDSYKGTDQNDYIRVTLTDEDDIPDAMNKLRVIYPNLMRLDYDNTRTRNSTLLSATEAVESRSPADLVAEFFEKQNGRELSPAQTELSQALIEEIWGRL